ncbi:hypothetical protein BMI86_20005 [Thioclava sp. DLFJ5-1]|uniref:HlyD family type I secretion periplasmic adaptor subunit n=1 Tax=Thioclava sp. DLFJ5-1 TaxID=1915314 RepID=UPI0009D5E3B0|nr:HlyD family type I secretion periplasmic adaptor subunit [Thioclava sp. DLFJ5-1]OOY18673.1 hypothetical protein BMI86_20005 [Thioclava sp. DLFJ5-1]
MRTDWSPTRPLLKGALVLALGLGGFLGWSFLTQVDGAVVAGGQVTVEARRQAIQHPDGGLVDAVLVRDGSTVQAGDPILILDGAELRTQQATTRRALVETLARMNRLDAEISDAGNVEYSEELRDIGRDIAGLDAILAEESALFQARRDTLKQTDEQLAERQVQTEAVVAGRARQLDASRRQLAFIEDELNAKESLLQRGLTEKSRVLAFRREAARLEGQIGELEAGIAEARSSIAGFEMERLRQKASFREAVQSELRDLQPRAAELRETLRLIDIQIGRLILRAPMSGTVLGLQVHTVGGVVPAGAEIASIVPANVPLVFSVEIDPRQIDRVHPGQEARIRFPNFNSRTTPEVDATVASISADAVANSATGRSFYLAELSLTPKGRDTLGQVELKPGMPVESFIRTDARSPASFLIKPVADYWAYAMREE